MKTGFDIPKPKMRVVSKWDNNDNIWKPGSTINLPHFDMFDGISDGIFTFSSGQQTSNYLGIVYNNHGFHLKTPATIYIGYEFEDLKLAEAVRENILTTCPTAAVIHIETPHILFWARDKDKWNAVFQIKSPHRKEDLKDRLHEVINWNEWQKKLANS